MKKPKNDNIILIGFMGVGKGRTARSLAARTGRYALDCDDLIESYANKKIKQIFQDEGEQEFRRLERKTANWLAENVRSAVISSGGGFIKVPNIREIGAIVYLRSDFQTILQEIQSHANADKKIKKRPLLADIKAAQKLYSERLPLYRELADIEVYMADRSIERVTEEIIDRLAAVGKK
jgi:shikimate kinase